MGVLARVGVVQAAYTVFKEAMPITGATTMQVIYVRRKRHAALQPAQITCAVGSGAMWMVALARSHASCTSQSHAYQHALLQAILNNMPCLLASCTSPLLGEVSISLPCGPPPAFHDGLGVDLARDTAPPGPRLLLGGLLGLQCIETPSTQSHHPAPLSEFTQVLLQH